LKGLNISTGYDCKFQKWRLSGTLKSYTISNIYQIKIYQIILKENNYGRLNEVIIKRLKPSGYIKTHFARSAFMYFVWSLHQRLITYVASTDWYL
jgi:hypothetical protein